MELLESIVAGAPAMAELRRDIHAHPELAFNERRTADLIAERLESWGIEVHRGIGRTGLVGVIKGGNSARAIGLRADMDALPLHEANSFEHASRHAGKMHACGHDGHTAMLLAAGQYLAENRTFDGTVYLIFQPAEENGGGAREMIADGLFSRFPMESVFAMHNWPTIAPGKFAVSPGAVMASKSGFRIVVKGKGGRAAMPHECVDPVPVACQLVQAFHTIISTNKRPGDMGVLTVTMIHAGETGNVIPDTCELKGTVRTFSPQVLEMIERRMRQVAEQMCAAYDTTCEFDLACEYPVTVNHTRESAFARGVLGRIVGPENILLQHPATASEDFAFMLQAKPGAYIWIGAGGGEHREDLRPAGPCNVHSPNFDFNDSIIPLGGTAWVRLVEDWLGHATEA